MTDPTNNPGGEPAIDPRIGEPEPRPPLGLLKRSFVIAIMVMSLMMLTGLLGSAFKPVSFLVWITKAIAWPPGLITNVVAPIHSNSVAAFAITTAAGMVITLAFYTVAAWIFLRFWPVLRSRSNKN